MNKNFKDKNEEIILPLIPDDLVIEYKNVLNRISFLNNNLEKIKYIYKYLDQYNEFVDTFSVCQKGCSFCCKQEVEITDSEALYIEYSTGNKIEQKYFNKKWDCPFLVDNSCSIYNSRPLACRTMHTLDNPKYCETNEYHKLYGANLGKGVPIYEHFAEIIKSLSSKRDDIRYYFKRAK